MLVQQAHLAQAGLTDLVCQPVSVCISCNRTHISHFHYTPFLASHKYVSTCRFLAQARVAEEISGLVQTHVLHDRSGSPMTVSSPEVCPHFVFTVALLIYGFMLHLVLVRLRFQLKHTSLSERKASTRVTLALCRPRPTPEMPVPNSDNLRVSGV
jgi:hypothetical protein